MKERREPGSRKGHPKMNRIQKQLAVTAGFLLVSMFPAMSKAQNNAPDSTPAQSQAMSAQQDDKGAGMANLNLTDDQKAQVKQIREGARSQADAVKNDSSLSAEQKEAKIKSIHRDAHVQMKKVLTPEQLKQMHENMRERHETKQQQAPPTK
jgi:Spy/CpxP family protein refolding chaperone